MEEIEKMVTPAGFEPATYRLGICRSIRLSYGAVELLTVMKANRRIAQDVALCE